ncbi:Signal transduction histidine kinase [Clostridium cavendishii DSM 21758]|uniref:histidine kinase n=1 Tax=Clostridium cavendishii DSM 21758 TaxID=1121302 RepID=A0A1M6SGP8_9CLOT|nr:HAMP domain-containing sensor histidine kinase [Clostridium cavendishii]SHK43923.1 Signal transduction histidine kinase [Clostridium cavendishii DSM 21758]
MIFNKNRTLRKKITSRCALILLISAALLNAVVKYIIDFNEASTIKNDMIMQQKNSTEFIKQYFILSGKKMDKYNFIIEAPKIANNLSDNYKCTIGIYNTDGDCEISVIKGNIDSNVKEHINEAKHNKSYTYMSNKISDYKGYFAYPYYNEDKFLGIVELVRDYESLIVNDRNIYMVFTVAEILSIFSTILIIYFIVSKSTRPLEKLKQGVEEISNGNYSYKINDISFNDEISDIAKDYNKMVTKLKTQIEDVHNLEKSRRDFFCNVTHELKTPLTTISGYGELLLDNYEDTSFRDKALHCIIDESNNLNNMICSILAVSKGQILSREKLKINIKELIEKLADEVSIRTIDKGISIALHLSEGYILGIPYDIKSLILNILENAFKYSPCNSQVSICGKQINNNYSILIKNKSYDVDNEFAKKAFEPFVRGNNSINERGNGLGLYICKQIVTEHGGDISMIIDYNEVQININLISLQ